MISTLPPTAMETDGSYDDDAWYEAVHQWLSFKKKMFPIVATILITLSILGTTGNALVLYVYGRKKDRLTSTFFILILAVTDFITCLVIVPFTVLVEYLHNRIYYEFPCRLYEFLITSNVPFSCFVMVAISFDRYFCICWPLKRIMTIERAKVVVLILAVFAMSLGVIPALSYGIHEDEQPFLFNETNQTISTNLSTSQQFPVTINPATVTSSSFASTRSAGTSVMAHDDETSASTSATDSYRENYTGICVPMTTFVSDFIRDIYQAVYATFFLLSITLVSILYILLYLSVRRRRLAKVKRSKQFELATRGHVGVLTLTINAVVDDDAEETDCVEVAPGQTAAGESIKEKRDSVARVGATPRSEANGVKEEDTRLVDRESFACSHRANQTFKKISAKERKANVRMAVMLFVVTLVFIITFLPAFLMAHRLVDHNPVIFYLYFAYNVANPMIYCFMNMSFRLELIKIFRCQGRGRSNAL